MAFVTLISFSLIGLLSASFLRYQYTMQSKLGKKAYCIVGSDCFNVTNSKYGRTFGLKNEDVGISYYVLIIILTLNSLINPETKTITSIAVTVATTAALAFSFYLLTAQTLLLRKYCFLCLVSIVINLAMFVTSWMLLN